MAFDAVHDVQRAYRKTVQAFSFPGRVLDLSAESEGQDIGAKHPAALFLLARMLLDAETSFSCADEDLAERIEMLTFARRKNVDDADFVFADGSGEYFLEALRDAPCGNLVDPHASATLVAVAEFGEGAQLWSLAGPGIEHTAVCRFSLAEGWDRIRAERNREFPLGLDLLLVSGNNRLVALPRTTRVTKGED